MTPRAPGDFANAVAAIVSAAFPPDRHVLHSQRYAIAQGVWEYLLAHPEITERQRTPTNAADPPRTLIIHVEVEPWQHRFEPEQLAERMLSAWGEYTGDGLIEARWGP